MKPVQQSQQQSHHHMLDESSEADRLRARVAELETVEAAARVAELERLRELIMHETGEDADGMMPHEPREALYILRRAAESALAKDAAP